MRQVIGLSEDGNEITLKKFSGNFDFPHSESLNPITAICLDIETTGFDPSQEKIIDLGYVVFQFDKESRKITEVKRCFSQLEDPKKPLSEEIQKLTGYDDDALKGKEINWEEVASDFGEASVIIAHNAKFDRAFLDSYLPISTDKIWACSFSQIEWKRKGHPSNALECLAMNHGFFYNAHTALADASACLNLISMIDPDTEKPYLSEILANASIRKKRVIAQGAGYDFKDELKRRGYRWNDSEKKWSILVPVDSSEEEQFIEANSEAGTPVVVEIAPKDNFKTNV